MNGGRRAAQVGTAALALALAGCAGPSLDERMLPTIGRPAPEIFAKIGFPDAEDTVAGRRFYRWETRSSGAYILPQSDLATVYGPDGPETWIVRTYERQPYSYFCKFRVFVDAQDRIAGYDFEGDGCATFARRLGRRAGGP